MELDSSREWPRLVWEDGTFHVRPGFLGFAVDPEMPAYLLHRGIMRFTIGPLDRALQVGAAENACMHACMHGCDPLAECPVAEFHPAAWMCGCGNHV